MLDLRLIRQQPELVREGLRKKNVDTSALDAILEMDSHWRAALQEVESLKARRNQVSEEIGKRKRSGADASELIEEMGAVSSRIKELDQAVKGYETEIEGLIIGLPNLPAPDVPYGEDESGNREVRRHGEPREFGFEPKAHWDIGTALDLLDFERAGKVTGSRFTVFRNDGARLVRALTNFMLDLHIGKHGYTEILPPFLVNSASMTGTGQLPKFAEDAFSVKDHDLWLVPTAEVPVTNLYRDEILDGHVLPIKHAAYTACFRSEAGSAGRDTRGLIRQHQFDKVELVWFTLPEDSEDALYRLMADAEAVLQRLGLPYRVLEICTGDLGFAATRKFDLEVWMPSYGRYVEISSCSNFGDFQARRAGLKFRREQGAKAELVHTLNGSGLAVGRTLAALLENYQNEDGSVTIPETLRPYMGGREILSI